MADVLLIHGAWHGSWCWADVERGLTAVGHNVRSIDLPDHSSPGEFRRSWATIGQYLSSVAEAAAEMDDPVLVGHSMGGYLVQRLLERAEVPLAILVAPVPLSLVAPNVRVGRKHPRALLRSIATADYRHSVASLKLVRDLFFTADTPETIVAETFLNMQSESAVAITTMLLRPPRPDRVSSPVRVIAAQHDALFSLTEQRALAAAYETTCHVIDGGHDLMLDTCWPELVTLVDQLITTEADAPQSAAQR